MGDRILPAVIVALLIAPGSALAQTRYRAIPAPKIAGALLTIRATNGGEVEVAYASNTDEGIARVPMLQIETWADSTERILNLGTRTRKDEELELLGPVLEGELGTSLQVVRHVVGDESRYELHIDGGRTGASAWPRLTQSQARGLVRAMRAADSAAREMTPADVAAEQERALALRAADERGEAATFLENETRSESPFYEFQVDRPARPSSDNPAPVYPPSLRAAGIVGAAVVQFVVDTAGRVDMSTFKVLASDHDLFTTAVREQLPAWRFTPAEKGGHHVPQVVQKPFTFPLPE